jgi:hypothetical protein
MCIPQRHAYPAPPILRIILYWNQVAFQDHLVLDNSSPASTAELCYTHEWFPASDGRDMQYRAVAQPG